jgi:hypothetical protein
VAYPTNTLADIAVEDAAAVTEVKEILFLVSPQFGSHLKIIME